MLQNDQSLSIERKHHGKGRECWSPAFFPFPSIFSKDLLLVTSNSEKKPEPQYFRHKTVYVLYRVVLQDSFSISYAAVSGSNEVNKKTVLVQAHKQWKCWLILRVQQK